MKYLNVIQPNVFHVSVTALSLLKSLIKEQPLWKNDTLSMLLQIENKRLPLNTSKYMHILTGLNIAISTTAVHKTGWSYKYWY